MIATKRKPIILWLTVCIIIICAVLATVWILYNQNEKIDSAKKAFPRALIYYDGVPYIECDWEKPVNITTKVLRKADDHEFLLILPGYDAIWSDNIERFIYSSGSKLMSCGIDGKQKADIWNAANEGIKCNFIKIYGISGSIAVIQCAKVRGLGSYSAYYDWDEYYYFIDIVSGKAINKWFRGSMFTGMQYLGCFEDESYFLKNYSADKDDGTGNYWICELEQVSLSSDDSHIILENAETIPDENRSALIAGGFLYYINKDSGDICRINLKADSPTVESLDINYSAYSANHANALAIHENSLFIAVGKSPQELVDQNIYRDQYIALVRYDLVSAESSLCSDWETFMPFDTVGLWKYDDTVYILGIQNDEPEILTVKGKD